MGLVLFFVAERASFDGAGGPRQAPDTTGYLRVAESPLTSGSTLVDKPLGAPLLYKVAGGDANTIVRWQSGLSVLAWWALALAVASELTRPLARFAALLAIPLLSLTAGVNHWDWVVLSESLSLSLLALVTGLSIVLARRVADDREVVAGLSIAWALAAAWFAWTRDSNLVLVVVLGLAMAVWLGVSMWLGRRSRRRHRRLLVGLALLAPAVLGAVAMAKTSGRGFEPMVNVVLQRVLGQPELHATWVERYGMPRNPVFESYAGRKVWHAHGGLPSLRDRFQARDPEVEDVRLWLVEHGWSAQVRHLVIDSPGDSVRAAARAYRHHFNKRDAERQFGRGAGRTGWTVELGEWISPRVRRPVALIPAVVAVGILLALVSPERRVVALAGVLLAASVPLLSFASYHADTSNVARHLAAGPVLLRLGLLLVVLASIDFGSSALAGPGTRRRRA